MFIENFFLASKAFAYLDPGSGSMLLQLLLAALFGAGILLRSQWNKLKALFGHKPSENEDDEQDDDTEK